MKFVIEKFQHSKESSKKDQKTDTDILTNESNNPESVESQDNDAGKDCVIDKESPDESQNLKEVVEKEESSTCTEAPKRKTIKVCKIGSDHIFGNKNNHDFAFNLLNMKVVMDGCGSGKHSEVGTRLFGQLFSRKVKEYFDKGESICEENFIEIVNNIFEKMLTLCDDTSFIFQNYCFTILVCFEFEDEFVVYSCGDGYIIKENDEGITFDKLDDGEYPCYYIYNFIEDKSSLKEYKEGVEFKISRFSKAEYFNVGVASDGFRYSENLLDVEKAKLMKFLHEGKGPQIEVLINRNNRKNEMFHDDISICF